MNTTKAEIQSPTRYNQKYCVLVKEYKFDTIRQGWFWVTKVAMHYQKREDAQKFAQRFNSVV